VPEFLTIDEVCKLLKLSDRTVYDLCRRARLPGAAKVAGVWRVEKQAVLDWLRSGGDRRVHGLDGAGRV
jgi:excisionase family DNA binding protein